jgi:hypothetical protein
MTDRMNYWRVKCMLARPLSLQKRAQYRFNGQPSAVCCTCVFTGILPVCACRRGAAQSGAITSTNYNPVGRQPAARTFRFEEHTASPHNAGARLACKAESAAPASVGFDKDGLSPWSQGLLRAALNTGGN